MKWDKSTREARFWLWFKKNEGRLFDHGDCTGHLMDELHKQLRLVHQNLVWEMSRVHTGKRDFIISADGILEAFSAVEALADAAPPLNRWNIIRFRPREPDYHVGTLRMGDVVVNAEGIECALCQAVSKNGSRKLGVEVFIPGCPSKNDPPFRRVAYVLLDHALGEYDVECKVGYIGIFPFEQPPSVGGDRIPFSRLRDEFDRLFEDQFLIWRRCRIAVTPSPSPHTPHTAYPAPPASANSAAPD